MKAILEAVDHGVLQNKAKVQAVFSNNPEAAGLVTAEKRDIKTHVIASQGKKREDYDRALMAWLETQDFDYIVLAGYMRIISPFLVKAYRGRMINIHPADTTEHQGLDGYEWAFDNNMGHTKVTVHYVTEELDAGQIIAQAEVDLNGAHTLEEVEERGLAVEHELYPNTLKQLFSGEKI